MSFAKPTFQLPDGRRLMVLDVRNSSGEPDGPIDECEYAVLGCGASPVWVSVASLRQLIQQSVILS